MEAVGLELGAKLKLGFVGEKVNRVADSFRDLAVNFRHPIGRILFTYHCFAAYLSMTYQEPGNANRE